MIRTKAYNAHVSSRAADLYTIFLPLALTITVVLIFVGSAVVAYSSSARNSLLRSRDQVADQQSQLQRSYNEIDRRIQELQQQKYTISRYLQDSDRSLRDIDRALTAEDQAYRNMR